MKAIMNFKSKKKKLKCLKTIYYRSSQYLNKILTILPTKNQFTNYA